MAHKILFYDPATAIGFSVSVSFLVSCTLYIVLTLCLQLAHWNSKETNPLSNSHSQNKSGRLFRAFDLVIKIISTTHRVLQPPSSCWNWSKMLYGLQNITVELYRMVKWWYVARNCNVPAENQTTATVQ